MTHLPSLPTELICQILGHLQPTTKLHEYNIPEEQRWDVRHWGRTVVAVACTCRTLRDIAIPLLYSRYEAALHSPVIPFIDRSTVDTTHNQLLRQVAIRGNGDSNDEYTPTPERLAQYRIWARGSELASYVRLETQKPTSEDAGQIELWRLISQAPNLETLSVARHNWPGKDTHSHRRLPLWLFPIVAAAQNIRVHPKYSGYFQKLHTISFNMRHQCGTWFIPLLSLPCLKSLSLGSWSIHPYDDDWEASLVWPEPTVISGVSELHFWDANVPAHVIVKIMDYCRALKSFKCTQDWGIRPPTDKRGKQWCAEILAGLQRQSKTLTSLALKPCDEHSSSRSEVEYGGLQGFQTLTALDCLDVPWHLILGSPGGFRNEQKCYEPTGDFQYPDLHDVLPNSLRHFKTSKDERSTPICAGIEQALYSLLPSSEEPNTLRLHSIEFAYNSAHYYNPLPMNFWRIQDAFQKAGVKFNYKLKLDPSDFCKPHQTGAASLLTTSRVGQ